MANFTSEAIGHQKFVAQCNQFLYTEPNKVFEIDQTIRL